MTSHLRARRRTLCALMVALLAFHQMTQPLLAATFVWNQTASGTSYAWTTSGNWTPAGFPDGTGDVASLTNDIAGDQTLTLDRIVSLATLNIGDATGTSAFTLNAGAGMLVLDGSAGSVAINKASGGNDTLATLIHFYDDLAITNTSAGSLTFTNAGALRSAAADISFNGTGSISVAGAISTAGDLTKNDAGTTTLSGASTYAGATLVNGGTLALSNAAALPARSAVTLATGATLDYLNIATAIGSLSGSGTVTASTASAARTLTIGRDETSTTFSGQFFGPTGQKGRLAITKIGAGTLTLAPLAGASSTAAGDFTGATTISGGALRLDFSQGTFTGTSMLASTPVTLSGGNLEVKGRSGGAISQTLGAITIGATGGSITMDANGSTSGTRLNFGAITSTAAGGTLLVNAPANTDVRFGTSLVTINSRIVFADGTGAYNWATNTAANTTTTGLATYADVAGTALTGTNTSNSRIDSATAAQTTTVASGGATTNSLKINAGAAGQSLSLGAESQTLTSGGLLFTGANDYSITGSTGTLKSNTATPSDLIIHQYGTGSLTIGAIIANGAGASTLTKAGTGRLILNGVNTFTGGVFVNGGILSFSDPLNALGAGIASAVAIRDGATLQYTGATATIAAGTSAGSHTFSLTGGNGTMDVANAGTTLTLSGVISGAGSLNKAGAGTLAIGVAATYTGSTIINEGTLRITAADFLPSTPLYIATGAFLDISAGSETVGSLSGGGTVTAGTTTSARTFTVGADNLSSTFTGTFLGTGTGHALTKTGSGEFILNMAAQSVWTGNTVVAAGVMRLGASSQLANASPLFIGNSSTPAVFDLNGFNQTLSATTTALTFYGSSATTTSNAHLTLGDGTLTLGSGLLYNNNGNSMASTITSNGTGGIVMTAARNFDIRDSTSVLPTEAELTVYVPLSGAGGITKIGAGTLHLLGVNTTTGTNTFNAGNTWLDYRVTNTARLGTGALSVGGGTLTFFGNGSAATSHTASSFTAGAGSGTINLVPGAGQDLVLNLGAITRAAGTGGVIRFNLPAGTQSATLGYTTTSANDLLTGLLGVGGGYAIVTDSSGVTQFATNVGGNIVGITPVAQDAVASWLPGQNLTDVGGYSGMLGYSTTIGSLRFNAAGASAVSLPDGGVLTVQSAGILQTSAATGGTASISGGFLRSGTGNELIFITDSATDRIEISSTLTGATILTKAGNGTLRIVSNTSYANDHTGAVNLYSGTLQLSGGNAIGDTATLNLSTTQNTVLELLSDETIGALAGNITNQTGITAEIRLTGGSLTVNDTGSTNRTFGGTFTGSGGFIRNGASNASNLLLNQAMPGFSGTLTINGGLVYLEGSGTLGNATTVNVNKGSSFMFSNNGSTRTGARVLDTLVINLNSADGSWSGENRPSGLSIRTDQNNSSNTSETIGVLNIASGASYARLQNSGGNSSTAHIIASNFVRTNSATLDVRGRSLGSTSGTGGQSHLKIVDSAEETAFMTASLVGGVDYTAGAKNNKIVPWAFGENLTAGLVETNMGNSLLSYADNRGFVALDLATEYNTYAASSVATENIRESLTASLTGLAGKTINALVLNNNNTASSSVSVSGSGAGQMLTLTAGTLLFTASTAAAANAAMGITLGGFNSGIAVGATNEYVIFVQNPSGVADSAVVTATISSPLISTADITKSGRGTLILSGTNTAGGGARATTLNEGILEIASLSNIGGATGGLVFAGGTLRLGSGFSDDMSGRTVSLLIGGGTLDTNGADAALGGISGAGSFTKMGAGALTLGGTSSYSGPTVVQNGSLILAGAGSNRLSSATTLTVGGGTTSGIVQLGTAAGAADQTLAGLSTSGTGLSNAIVGGSSAVSTLTINQSTSSTFGGDLGGAGANQNNLALVKSGIGALTLSGATLSYTGSTVVNAGTLNITGGTSTPLATSSITVAGGSTLNLINGAGQTINLGSGTLNLGSGSGTTILGFEIGSPSAYDSIRTTGAAVTANNVLFNFTGLAGLAAGSYDLLTAASGLDTATYTIGSFTNAVAGLSYTLAKDPAFVRLTAAATAAGDLYWRGAVNGSWLGFDGSLNANFTTDSAGTVNAMATPGASNRVIFSAASAVGPIIGTSLDGSFTILDLHFTAAPAGVTGVNITPGSVSTNSLTITPSAGSDGIDVAANAGAITISAPVVMGAAQTWNVASGTSLAVTGAVSGGTTNSTQADPGQNVFLTITGGGNVSLGSTSNTFMGDILVNGGTYSVDNVLDWGGPTVASTTSHTIILQNGGKLRVTGSVNPGSITTTSYDLVQVNSGGATIETLAGATLTLDDSGQLFGSGDLTKTGAGTLTLRNQTASFLGALTIAEGLLQLSTSSGGVGAFGSTAAGTTIQSGAAVNLAGQSVAAAEADVLTISGDGLAAAPTGVITNSSASTAASYAGAIVLAGDSTVGAASGGGLTLSGGVTGAFDLAIKNLSTGGTTLSTNSINNAGTITNISTGTGGATVSGVIGTNVTQVIQNSATSTMTLGAVANLWSGGLVIKAGTLTGGNNANTFGASNNVITLGDASGSANATLQAVNSLTYAQNITVAGGNTGTATIVAGTTTGSVIFGGAITLDNHDVTLAKAGTTGASQFTGGITGTGNVTISNNATTGTLSLNTTLLDFTGSLSHTSSATGTTTIGASIGSNVTSITQSSASSVLTLSGTSIAYTGATVVNAGTLNITGGAAAALTTTGLTVAGGATLNLLNGAGWGVDLGAGAINLGAGTGSATLGLELGATTAYDHFISTAAASTANAVVLNLTGLAGLQAGTYDLLTAASGLDAATYSIGSFANSDGFSYTLSVSPTLVRLTAATLAGSLYWNGGLSSSWATTTGSYSTNFTTDLAGTLNANGLPGSANRVIFSSAGAAGPAITTTLDRNFTIGALDFIASPSGVTSVTIASGTPSTSTLTINPSVSTDGISIAANAGAITLSARVALGADQTWNVDGTGANGSSLTVSGVISGTGNLTKTGGGVLTLTGTNTYTGTTTISAGVVQLSGTNASPYVVESGGILRMNNATGAIGALSGSGTVENGPSATAARTLTVGSAGTSTTFSGVLQDGGSFALNLTKTGAGALTLSGASIHTGSTTVSNGVLNVTGSITGNTTSSVLAFGGTANKTTVNVSGDLTLFSLTGGNTSGGTAVYNQTAGTVFVQGNNSSATYIANAAGSYGYFNLTGGTFKEASRFALAVGTNLATQATAVAYIGGNGFLDLRNSEWMLNYSHGHLTVADNGVVDRSGATASYGLIMNSSTAGGQYGVLNVAGGSFLTTTQPLRFGNNTGAGLGNNNVAFINLAAGTLQVGTAMTVSLPSDGANNAYLNFAGGTLKTSAGITNWIPASSGAITFTATLFGAVNNSAVAGAPSFSGGLVFDTNGFNSSLNAALKGATGSGVTQADMTVAGGSGYTGAPEVVFSSAGVVAGGTPAAGYALIDNGQVAGIVITSPGTYTPGTVPTVTLTGGGTGASVTLGALNTANTSGGLTKTGAGTLTLSGANTYTGATVVNAGSLVLGAASTLSGGGPVAVNAGSLVLNAANAISGSSAISVNGGSLVLGIANALADSAVVTVNSGSFDIATYNDTVGGVTLSGGSITGTTGVLTSASAYELRQGSAGAILGGSVGVNKTTAGTVTLTGANTFSGAVNVTGGVLSFTTSGNLGNASATNTLSLGGGTLSYTGTGALDLGASRIMTIAAAGGTVEVPSSTGVLTLPSISASSSGSLIKTGAGTLVITAPVSLNGGAGAVTVADGTLRASFGTSGISALTVGSSGVLSLQNSLAEVLALGSTPGALTLGNGARLSLELGAPGTSDRLVAGGSASVSGTVTLDLLNLGTLGAGTYVLLQAMSGLDNASYVLGSAPSGFNYTLNVTGTQVSINTSVLVARYWSGLQGSSWNAVNAGATSWSTTANGLTDAGAVPGPAHTVIFSGGNVTGTAIATTLDAAFTVDSLQFLNVPATIASVTIAPGSGGSLTLNPASSSNGIFVAANGGAVTISAPVTVAGVQTWNVNGSGASSLTIDGNVTFSQGVTKTGAGTLTLSGSNSGSGGLTLAAGTLNINSPAALGTGPLSIAAGTTINNSTAGAITLSTNNAQHWDGSFTFTGTQALNLGTGTVSVSGNTTVTTTASTLTVGGPLVDDGGSRSLAKAGAGTLTLAGDNVGLSGGVVMTAGTLNINHARALGTGAFTITGGTIDNATAGAITLATNNAQNWNGSFTFTGTQSLNLGTGAVTLGANVTATVSAGTLAVGGPIGDGSDNFGLTKAGTGTLHLTASSTYDGPTTIQAGTLTVALNDALPVGTVLTVGAGTTAATVNLGSFSQTVGGLASTASTAAVSSIVISSGQTLTVNGNVSLNNNTDNAQTNLTLFGGGALAVNGTSFTVGNNTTGSGSSSRATLNLTALSSVDITLTGTLAVQLTGDNDASHLSSLLLSNTANTITASTLSVGASSTSGTHSLVLGSGTNVINANTFNIGTGGRDAGSVTFSGTSGSLVLRNATGAGRAALNIGTGSATTAAVAINTFDVAGHNADLLISTLAIGTQNRNGNLASTFAFDTGTLDATTVVVGGNNGATASTTAANGVWTANMNLGGGTVTIGTGGIDIANGSTAVTGTDVLNGNVTISGGTVTVGNSTTLGAAIRLANSTQATGLTSNGVLTISGGSLTVAGHIIKGSSTGAGTATVTLNGGTLDMSGKNIGGDASATVIFNAQAGTLRNLAELNNGAGLVKTTGGTLVLEGSNTYTGGTTISAGVLQVGSGAGTGSLGSGAVTNNTTLAFNRNNAYVLNEIISGAGAVIQAGSGTTTLGGANTYTGKTTITAGKLAISSESNLGANPGAAAADQLTLNGGTLQTTATLAIDDANRGITVGAAGGAIETAAGTTTTISSIITGSGALAKEGAGTLVYTAVATHAGTVTVNGGILGVTGTTGGAMIVNSGGTLAAGLAASGQLTITDSLVINSGGTLAVELGGATFNAAEIVFNEMNAHGNLTAFAGSLPSSDWENYVGGTTQHDHLQVNGASASMVNGTVKVSGLLGGYNPVYGDIFDLVDWSFASNLTGTPSYDFSDVTLAPGLGFNTDLFLSNGILVVVPEPSRALLLLGGLLGLLLRRRRR